MSYLLLLAGLALLVLGSRWLVSSATTIAAAMGVSELIIGLTIVAAGNVVGSNIFNILAVLGLTAMVAPGGLPVSEAAINFDYPVILAASEHDALPWFSNSMLYFIMPLTVITLLVVLFHEYSARHPRRAG